MNTRRATLRDLKALMALEELCFAEGERNTRQEYQEALRKHDELFWVVHERGSQGLVASLLVEHWPSNWELVAQAYRLGQSAPRGDAKTAYLASIAVHPFCRRKGLAKDLVAQALEHLTYEGAQMAVLATRANNIASQWLAKNLGFKPAFLRGGFFASKPDEEVWFFSKRLG